jgi:site-specific DNA recombinase
MQNSKPIGIWLRVSTEDQVRGESLEVHEKRARSYAESKDWEVAEVYRLEAVSGKRVSDHPEARRMLADIKRGHITGLIFSKLARLSRNNRELLDFSEAFQASGADLISLAENIDTSSPAGRMFFNMLAAMAAWEREEIVARVKASVPVRAQLGRPLGGQAQYGYAWVDKQFVLEPAEAAVRKLMYELFLEHRRMRTIARILTDRGYRTRHGKAFAGTTIERLLRDPTAKGQKRYNYTQSTGMDKAWVHKAESDWVTHECPRIVSDELWEEVNSLLSHKKLSGVRTPRKVANLFSGLCYCACGHKMYVPSGVQKYVCNKNGCRSRIETEVLEAIFESELETFSKYPETLELSQSESETKLTTVSELITGVELNLRQNNQQIDSLLTLHQSGALDVSGFKGRYQSLGEHNRELEAELPKLVKERDSLEVVLSTRELARAETKDVARRYSALSFPERRRFIETVLEQVVIGDGEVSFTYLFDPKH